MYKTREEKEEIMGNDLDNKIKMLYKNPNSA
jgi:hypothetical protein